MSDPTGAQQTAESQLIQVSVTPLSPHVVACRFWQQPPGDDTTWTQIGEGHTGAGAPVVISAGPLVAGSTIAWWLAVSGRANSDYRVSVALSRGGAPLPGCSREYPGLTSASGGAVVEDRVVLP